jgi:thiamine biosynthesis lipoprotein
MRVDGALRRHRFRVMGCDAEILCADGSAELAEMGEARLRRLESLWSRFLPSSEVSLLNAAPRQIPFVVSDETFGLFQASVRGWELTEGRFDPTLLDEIVEAGYDRTFAEVPALRPQRHIAARVAPRRLDIDLDPVARSVTLGTGVSLDAGGIGKGLAADLVSADLIEAGATGGLVNVGGDLRVRSRPGHGEPWTITLEDPHDASIEIGEVTLHDGGIATSSLLKRTWQLGNRRMHHILDPFTGQPTDGQIVSVSAVAATAWWAEAVAKAAFVSGISDGQNVMRRFGTPGVVVGSDTTHHFVPDRKSPR